MIRAMVIFRRFTLLWIGISSYGNSQKSFPEGEIERLNYFISGAAHPECEILLNKTSKSMNNSFDDTDKFIQTINILEKDLPKDCFGQLGVQVRLDFDDNSHLCWNSRMLLFQIGASLTAMSRNVRDLQHHWSLMIDEPIVSGIDTYYAGSLVRLEPVDNKNDICHRYGDSLSVEWLNSRHINIGALKHYLTPPVLHFGSNTSRFGLSLLNDEMRTMDLTNVRSVRFNILHSFAGRKMALEKSAIMNRGKERPNYPSFPKGSTFRTNRNENISPMRVCPTSGNGTYDDDDEEECTKMGMAFDMSVKHEWLLKALCKDQRNEFHYVFQLGEEFFRSLSQRSVTSLRGIRVEMAEASDTPPLSFEVVQLPSVHTETLACGRLVNSKNIVHRGVGIERLENLLTPIPLTIEKARISLRLMGRGTVIFGRELTSLMLRFVSQPI